ncbi:UNVERIFIED_CONTAM: hypothetical protein GTU68_004986, partial [Idotea baltica]|nr:hypothetical protein [Idotea baltica]
KIFCIGRNYADHAKELGNNVPTKPLVFSKFQTSLLKNDFPFFYPNHSKCIQHELELVIRICKNGKGVQEKFAHKYYDAIALGIDLTARDVQSQLKEKGHPWEIAKGFDHSAPISEFVPFSSLKNKKNINFSLEINGELKQEGFSKHMIFSFDNLISYLSQYFLLQMGDMIFTGTPAGVGEIKIGDELVAKLEGKQMMCFEVK